MAASQREERQQLFDQIVRWPVFSALSNEGRNYITSAVLDGPSRKVGGGPFALSGALPVTQAALVGYESEAPERTYLFWAQTHSDDVLLSQPPQVRALMHDALGRLAWRWATPDYLRISRTSATLVEAKHLAKLSQLARKYPKDWAVLEGTWTHKPLATAAELLGMGFEIFYPEFFTPVLRSNFEHFARIKNEPPAPLSTRVIGALTAALAEKPATIEQIVARHSIQDADQLICLIRDKVLFALTEKQQIAPDLLLYATALQVEDARATLARLGKRDDPVSEAQIALIGASAKARARAEDAAAEYHDRRRRGDPFNATDYRRRNAMEAAEESGASALAGLLPLYSRRGGAGPAYPAAERAEIMARAATITKNLKGKYTLTLIHASLHEESDLQRVPSHATLRNWINQDYSRERMAALTGGPRAIRSQTRKTDGVNCVVRPDLGGMFAQIDAVYADVKVEGKQQWADTRPIVYPLLDVSSQCVLAAGITFGKPSTHGTAMAVRRCAEDRGFIPRRLNGDGGTEFDNNWRREYAKHTRTELGRTATAASVMNGEVEGFQGHLQRYLQQLHGGTFYDQVGRGGDRKKKGASTALFNCTEIVDTILNFIAEWNAAPHGDNSSSPSELFARDRAIFPNAVRHVSLDDDFLYITSFPLRRRGYSHGHGMAYGGRTFASDFATDILRKGMKLAGPRLDATDPTVLWASTDVGLIRLTSREHHAEQGNRIAQRVAVFGDLRAFHRNSKMNQQEWARVQVREAKKATSAAFERKAREVEPTDAALMPHPTPANTAALESPFEKLRQRPRTRLDDILSELP